MSTLLAFVVIASATYRPDSDMFVLAVSLGIVILGGVWSMGLPRPARISEWLTSPTVRAIEVVAVLFAVFAFSYDFLVEKPRDRAVRNGQLLAQIADLARGGGK